MKRFEFIAVLILTLMLVLSFQNKDRDNKIKIALETINKNQVIFRENQITMQQEIQTIQDSYVSYDDIHPLMEMFDEYQLEVDQIRNNVNDFNGLFNQLFDYEQKQYVMWGK